MTDLDDARDETEVLEQRFTRETDLRDLLQSKLKHCQSELDGLVAKQPKRPRERIAELDQKIVALERERTINSIDLKEEREILKQIHRVEKLKREVEVFEAHDKLIKDKKAHIADLKEQLKNVRINAEALYSELLMTKTANRVGCKKEELVGTTVTCPHGKLGEVIGKKGSNVRQLQTTASVTVDVRKDGDVRIMGAPDALDAATANLQKMIDAVEENLEAPPGLIAFLTSRHITARKDLADKHPEVRFSVQRQATVISMKGIPSDIENLKRDILDMGVATREIELTDVEVGNVVGKQGTTVEGLVVTYQVAIEADRKGAGTSVVTLSGPSSSIDVVAVEIEKLASEVRETTHAIEVSPLVKDALLANNGVGIQEINKRINENKQVGFVNSNFDGNKLVLRGRAKHLPDAVAIADERIRRIESLIVTIDVDPTVIPALIGKGGETIKKIEDGRPVAVEVDSKKGKVFVCGCDEILVDSVVQGVKDFIAGNVVNRISVDASLFKRQSLELVRSKSRTITALCRLSLDEDKCEIVLRGEPEKLPEAVAIVKEFLATNYTEEVSMTAEDMQTLLIGGKNSRMMELETELDVKLNAERDRDIVEVRGEQEKVQLAVKALNQFLFGGDGVSVLKIALNENLMGMVIGKGGKTKADLQKKFSNVSILVDGKVNTITLRGPEKEVEECRLEVSKIVANAQVTETIEISQKTHQHLSAKNSGRAFVGDVPVQLTLTEDSLKVRGFSADVRDAIALLNEGIHGRYETRLVLCSPQFAQIKNSCRQESSPLQRVMDTSGTSIVLDSSDEAIVFRGTRSHVKAAKQELMAFLDFLFGTTFSRIQLKDPLIPTVGRIPLLSEVSAVSGASVHLDRDTGLILVFSTDAEKVETASAILQGKIEEASKLYFELMFAPSEDWILSSIIGKKGAKVNKLRKETKCDIDVDSKERTVLVKSKDPELIVSARKSFDDLVDELRRGNAFVEMSDLDLPAYIGRAGVGIIAFSEKYGVDAKVLKTSPPSIRFQGEESAVVAAKAAALEWIKAKENARREADVVETVRVRRDKIPAVIGVKGATIRSLETEFGCKLDIDRDASIVSVRGGNAEKRAATIAKIKAILAEERRADSDEEGPTSGENPHEEQASSLLPEQKPTSERKPMPERKPMSERKPIEAKPRISEAITTRIPSPPASPPTQKDFPMLGKPSTKNRSASEDSTISVSSNGNSMVRGFSWSSIVSSHPVSEQSVSEQSEDSVDENSKPYHGSSVPTAGAVIEA